MKFDIIKDFPNDIIFERNEPCLSLYQPTHRHRPDNKQDIIRFKNLVKELEGQLLEIYSQAEADEILKPFYDLEKDKVFWNNTKDGLVILMDRDRGVIYKLSRPVKEFANIGRSFHIKPLVRTYQSADTYYVLGINRQTFKLFVGNRYELQEVKFDEDTAVNIEDVLGDQFTDSYLNQRSVGGSNAMFHGQGSKKDEIDKDIENYFRYVDRLVLENFSNPTKAPLVLVSLDEYHGLMNSISHNRLMLKDGIRKDFETLDLDALREEAWKIVEPLYIDRTRELVDRFEAHRAQGQASDDYIEVAKAAVEGKVESVLIESDRIIPGIINYETGSIVEEDIKNPEAEDLLDDLAEIVFENKGEVVMLPKDRMPTDRGIAAIFRY